MFVPVKKIKNFDYENQATWLRARVAKLYCLYISIILNTCFFFHVILFQGSSWLILFLVSFLQVIWFQGPMRRLSTDDELLLEGRENRLILSIETMKEKYFANFTCQADNEMGRSTATLTLSGAAQRESVKRFLTF